MKISCTVQIIVEKRASDHDYAAYAPGLAGCFARGATLEETLARARRSVEDRIEALLREGKPLPEDERVVYLEALTVTVHDRRSDRGSYANGARRDP